MKKIGKKLKKIVDLKKKVVFLRLISNNKTVKKMKIKLFKTALKCWHEIVFVVSIGFVLFKISKYVMLGNTMDAWDIFIVCLFFPLFVCLIGQLFWKNQVLAFILSPILGLISIVFIFASLYALTSSLKLIISIAMLIFGIFLLIAAITMPIKNYAPDNFGERIVS